jgi:hypothetical protein
MCDLKDSFRWKDLGNGKVVDVGGGRGHVSTFLAEV